MSRRWRVGACAVALDPLVQAIRAHVLSAERIHADDTTVPVLAKLESHSTIQDRRRSVKTHAVSPIAGSWSDAYDPLIPVKVTLNAIVKAFDNQRLGTQINDMHWAVIDLSKASHHLVTSDRPLQYQNLSKETGFISLPIGPAKLFLATNSPQSISNVRAQRPEYVVKEVNKFVVSRARRFVFAQNESQAGFVKKYIHKNMEPTPLFPRFSQ
jgi:hypothetical protein